MSDARRDRTLAEARWRGDLALDERRGDPLSYYQRLVERAPADPFEFRRSYWRPQREKDGAIQGVREISNFVMVPLYVIKRKTNDWEFSRVYEVRNHTHVERIVLERAENTSNDRFAAAMDQKAACSWYGEKEDLKALRKLLAARDVPIVREVMVVGYDRESDGYIFTDHAYDPAGHRVDRNGSGFYDFGTKGRSELITISQDLEKAPAQTGALDIPQLLHLLRQASGGKSLAVLAFHTAALFAVQFSARETTPYFPFLSLVGPPGAGKTSELRLMNLLCGRAPAAGLTLAKANSVIFKARSMGLAANLVTHVHEMNETAARDYDWAQFLTLYDRMPVQGRGNKSNDNRVNVTEFQGALAFVANREHFPRAEHRSRVITITYSKADHTDQSATAIRDLARLAEEGRLPGFRHQILSRRAAFQEAFFRQTEVMLRFLRGEGITDARVAQNHAVVLGAADALLRLFCPAPDAQDLRGVVMEYVLEIARKKQRSLRNVPDELRGFFDVLLDLIDNGALNNWADGRRAIKGLERHQLDNAIAFRLADVEAVLAEQKIRMEPQGRLSAALRDFPGMLAEGVCVRVIDGGQSATKRCWVLDRRAIETE